jgi:hypothetical protein
MTGNEWIFKCLSIQTWKNLKHQIKSLGYPWQHASPEGRSVHCQKNGVPRTNDTMLFVVGGAGHIPYLHKSPVLTPCDLCFRGYLKCHVYRLPTAQTLPKILHRIKKYIASFDLPTYCLHGKHLNITLKFTEQLIECVSSNNRKSQRDSFLSPQLASYLYL